MKQQDELRNLLNIPPFDSLSYQAKREMRYLETPESAAQYRKATQDWDNASEYLQIGQNLLDQDRKEEAIIFFDLALFHGNELIKHMPNSVDGYQYLASALFFKGNYNEVIRVCETAFKIEPDTPHFHFQWGRALLNIDIESHTDNKAINSDNCLDEAIAHLQKELAITGAILITIHVLMIVYDRKRVSLSKEIKKNSFGPRSIVTHRLRETLDCQIICLEKLIQLVPNAEYEKWINDLRRVRGALGNARPLGATCLLCDSVKIDVPDLIDLLISEGHEVPVICRRCVLRYQIPIESAGTGEHIWYNGDKYIGYSDVFYHF